MVGSGRRAGRAPPRLPGVSPLVFGLLAAAALMHATWNVLLKTAGDPLRTSARAMLAGAGVAVPAAFAGWLAIGRPALPPEALGLAFASGLVETVYFVLLSAAYRRGDLSLVYPIARGSAPLLAVLSGTLILGERITLLGATGVAFLLAGILCVQRPWTLLFGSVRRPAPGRQRDAVLLALATGAAIATYSSIDRVGTRLVAPWLYEALLWVVGAAGLVAWIAAADRLRSRVAAVPGDLPDELPAPPDAAARAAGWGRSIAVGVLLLATYFLVLVALTLAPLTAVAPLRESAIVIGSGWGALRLGEAAGRREAAWRLAGAALIVAGALLLGLAG